MCVCGGGRGDFFSSSAQSPTTRMRTFHVLATRIGQEVRAFPQSASRCRIRSRVPRRRHSNGWAATRVPAMLGRCRNLTNDQCEGAFSVSRKTTTSVAQSGCWTVSPTLRHQVRTSRLARRCRLETHERAVTICRRCVSCEPLALRMEAQAGDVCRSALPALPVEIWT